MKFVLIDGMCVSPEEINRIQINSDYVYYAICPQEFTLTNHVHVRVIEDLMDNEFAMYVASKVDKIAELANEVIVLTKDAKLLKTFFDMKGTAFKNVNTIDELPKPNIKTHFINIFEDINGYDLSISETTGSKEIITEEEEVNEDANTNSKINKVELNNSEEDDYDEGVIGDSSHSVYSPESNYMLTEQELAELGNPSLNDYKKGYTEMRKAQIKSDMFR